jgi:hypothetical protein
MWPQIITPDKFVSSLQTVEINISLCPEIRIENFQKPIFV